MRHRRILEKPTPHLLAYIDALGFSSLVGQTFDPKVYQYLDVTDAAKLRWAADPIRRDITVRSIGDAQILTLPIAGHPTSREFLGIDDPDFELKFWHFACAVGELQVDLALRDIWTRGAVVYDQLLPRKDTILGPAFYRAYRLEEKQALFPRVVIDGKVFTSASKGRRDLICSVNEIGAESPLFEYSGCMRWGFESFDQDVPSFIDFLDVAPIGKLPRIDVMDQVAALVGRRLGGDMAHFSKYQWLVHYLIDKLTRESGDKERAAQIIERLRNG